MIKRAVEFAAKAHHGQFRKGTDIPYISHLSLRQRML
jgi:GTP diphosphokinase / guanosine-3',5'-bis(diphosphate) 3'-diphosphatase